MISPVCGTTHQWPTTAHLDCWSHGRTYSTQPPEVMSPHNPRTSAVRCVTCLQRRRVAALQWTATSFSRSRHRDGTGSLLGATCRARRTARAYQRCCGQARPWRRRDASRTRTLPSSGTTKPTGAHSVRPQPTRCRGAPPPGPALTRAFARFSLHTHDMSSRRRTRRRHVQPHRYAPDGIVACASCRPQVVVHLRQRASQQWQGRPCLLLRRLRSTWRSAGLRCRLVARNAMLGHAHCHD